MKYSIQKSYIIVMFYLLVFVTACNAIENKWRFDFTLTNHPSDHPIYADQPTAIHKDGSVMIRIIPYINVKTRKNTSKFYFHYSINSGFLQPMPNKRSAFSFNIYLEKLLSINSRNEIDEFSVQILGPKNVKPKNGGFSKSFEGSFDELEYKIEIKINNKILKFDKTSNHYWNRKKRDPILVYTYENENEKSMKQSNSFKLKKRRMHLHIFLYESLNGDTILVNTSKDDKLVVKENGKNIIVKVGTSSMYDETLERPWINYIKENNYPFVAGSELEIEYIKEGYQMESVKYSDHPYKIDIFLKKDFSYSHQLRHVNVFFVEDINNNPLPFPEKSTYCVASGCYDFKKGIKQISINKKVTKVKFIIPADDIYEEYDNFSEINGDKVTIKRKRKRKKNERPVTIKFVDINEKDLPYPESFEYCISESCKLLTESERTINIMNNINSVKVKVPPDDTYEEYNGVETIHNNSIIIHRKEKITKSVCLVVKNRYNQNIKFELLEAVLYHYDKNNDYALEPIEKKCFELKEDATFYAVHIPKSNNFTVYKSKWLEYEKNKILPIILDPAKKTLKFEVIDANSLLPIEGALITVSIDKLNKNSIIVPHEKEEFYSTDIQLYYNENFSYTVKAKNYTTISKKNVHYIKENELILVKMKPIIKKTRIEANIYYKEEGKHSPLKEGTIKLKYQDIDNKTKYETLIYSNKKERYVSSLIPFFATNPPILSINKTRTFYPIKSFEVKNIKPEIQMNFCRPTLYIFINPSRRLMIKPLNDSEIRDIFKDKIYFFIKELLNDPKWKKEWGRRYVYSWHKNKEPNLIYAQRDMTPDWKNVKKSIMNIGFINSHISYKEVIYKVSSFLDGFSYPDDKSIKGVLIYILGGPSEFMDDKNIEKLNNELKEHRLVAIIKKFGNVNSPFLEEYNRKSEMYNYIRFMETEIQKSFDNGKFGPTFRELYNELNEVFELLGEKNEIN